MKKKSAKTTAAKTGTRLKKAVKRVLSKTVSARKKKAPSAVPGTPTEKKSAAKNPNGTIVRKPAALSAAAPLEVKDLPYSYNKTTLVLLVRDPEWGYAYWDFSGETWNWIQGFLKKDPSAKFKIRIHNLTGGDSFDVDVQLETKNWYICFAKDNQEFEAEIGLMDSSGHFHSIVKSNRVRTPRSRPSDKIDPKWDPRNFEELYRLSGGGQYGGGSESLSNFSKKNY